MAELEAHVGQLNDEFAATKRLVEEWRTSEFTESIEPGLGTVTVLGTGELKAIELRTYRVAHYSGAALGRAVLEAIHRAEQRLTDGDRK